MFVAQTYDVPLWRYIAFCTHPSNEFVTNVTDNPASQSLRMPSETRIEQIGTLYLSITLRIGLKTQTLSLGQESQPTTPCSIVFIYCSILFIYCYSGVTGLHPKRAYYPLRAWCCQSLCVIYLWQYKPSSHARDCGVIGIGRGIVPCSSDHPLHVIYSPSSPKWSHP